MADAIEENQPEQEWTYHAEYADAEDVRGTVTVTGMTEALNAAAEDLLHQVGKDPISYGKLVKVVVTSADGGLTTTVTPEYDEPTSYILPPTGMVHSCTIDDEEWDDDL